MLAQVLSRKTALVEDAAVLTRDPASLWWRVRTSREATVLAVVVDPGSAQAWGAAVRADDVDVYDRCRAQVIAGVAAMNG